VIGWEQASFADTFADTLAGGQEVRRQRFDDLEQGNIQMRLGHEMTPRRIATSYGSDRRSLFDRYLLL
jgi:hypothetical protein